MLRLVAEISRMLTFTGRREPTGSTSPSWMARSSLTWMSSGSSATSSRNSVPPSASWNLPRCFCVAPVKAPFSWPNRIDSTRFSGMAPQLTATKGRPARSLSPWMARAIISLPTPDSPSISIGMLDWAPRRPRRSTLAMAGAEAMRSLKLRAPPTFLLSRFTSSVRALTLSRFWTDTLRRSGLTGLTTKSSAPARIALMTVSIEPWAVCTMTGRSPRIACMRSRNSSPDISGMLRSRMTSSMVPPDWLFSTSSAFRPPSTGIGSQPKRRTISSRILR